MEQREIKFRYVLRNKHTGYIHKKIYTLNQIQKSGLSGLFDIENYDIISIDQFIELKDKNSNEIYERDILIFDDIDESNDDTIGVGDVYYSNSEMFGFDIRHRYSYLSDILSGEIQIIGNIHENKNLLNNE